MYPFLEFNFSTTGDFSSYKGNIAEEKEPSHDIFTHLILNIHIPHSLALTHIGHCWRSLGMSMMINHLMVSVMMAALWSLLNLMLSVFLPFLNVMMNSLLGWLACTRKWS